MEASEEGEDLIKYYEGFEKYVYKDSNNINTIGYGHALKPGENYKFVTEKQAEDILKKDIKFAEECVNRLVKVRLKQNEFDALVSFVYNIGVGSFARSTALKYLNMKDYKNALKWWAKWIRNRKKEILPGLVKRRKKEIELFNNNIYLSNDEINEFF